MSCPAWAHPTRLGISLLHQHPPDECDGLIIKLMFHAVLIGRVSFAAKDIRIKVVHCIDKRKMDDAFCDKEIKYSLTSSLGHPCVLYLIFEAS